MLTARTLWVPIVIALFVTLLLASQPVVAQTLDGNATVSGIVEDESSEAPLTGMSATVRVSGNNDDSDRTGFTNTLGRYFLRDGDPLELTNRNVITASESLEAEVQIEGVVTSDATGLPMGDVIVRIYDTDNQLVYETDTDGSGAYSVFGLSTGQYYVEFDPSLVTGFETTFFPEYFDDKATLELSTPVNIATGLPPVQADAGLEPRKVIHMVATSPSLDNAIVVSFKNSFIPMFTTDGGSSWSEFPARPWQEKLYPRSVGDMLSVGIASRQEITRPVRFIVVREEHTDATFYRTGDNGETWAEQSIYICAEGYHNEITVGEIKVGHSEDSGLFVVIDCFAIYDEITAPTYHKVYMSVDHGLQWKYLWSGREVAIQGVMQDRIYVTYKSRSLDYNDDPELDPGCDWTGFCDRWKSAGFPVYKLIPDEVSPQRLYGLEWESVRETNTVVVTATTSIDAGDSWTEMVIPCATTSEGDPTLVAIPGHVGVLMMVCASEGTAHRSLDGGATWERLEDITGAYYLAVDRRQEGSVFVGKADGLWLTTDIGDSWTRLLEFPAEKWRPSSYLSLPLIRR